MVEQTLNYETVRLAVQQRGNRKEWALIQARMYRTVTAILGTTSPDVPDVMQESVIHVIEGFPRLSADPARGSISGWLGKIAKHTTLDRCRRSKLYVSVFCNDEPEEEPMYHGPFDQTRIEIYPDRPHFRAALDSLSPAFRATFALRVFEGCDTKEIAEELGIDEGTVRSRLHRATQMMRTYLATFDQMRVSATAVPIRRLGT